MFLALPAPITICSICSEKVLPLLKDTDPDVAEAADATFKAYDWSTEEDSEPAAAAEAAAKVDIE